MVNKVTTLPVKTDRKALAARGRAAAAAMMSSVSVPAELLKAYSDWLGTVGSEEKSATKLRDIAIGFGIVSDYCKSPSKESTDQQHIAAFGLAKDLITAKLPEAAQAAMKDDNLVGKALVAKDSNGKMQTKRYWTQQINPRVAQLGKRLAKFEEAGEKPAAKEDLEKVIAKITEAFKILNRDSCTIKDAKQKAIALDLWCKQQNLR
jgi:hypothetical protein